MRDAGKSKAARKEETAAREASFIQKTLPDLFNMSAREATHDAWARFCFGTGQSFGAGSHHLFHDIIRALRHDPHWSPEHGTTISGTRLDQEFKRVGTAVRKRMDAFIETNGCTISTNGWTNAKVRLLFLYVLYSFSKCVCCCMPYAVRMVHTGVYSM